MYSLYVHCIICQFLEKIKYLNGCTPYMYSSFLDAMLATRRYMHVMKNEIKCGLYAYAYIRCGSTFVMYQKTESHESLDET